MNAPSFTKAEFSEAVEDAFNEYKEKVGDYCSWSWAINESRAEDFAQSVLKNLGIEISLCDVKYT